MGSLLDLGNQSLTCVVKARALTEAMVAVILGSSTPGVASGLVQMEAMEIAASGIVSYQKLSHHGSDLLEKTLYSADGACMD